MNEDADEDGGVEERGAAEEGSAAPAPRANPVLFGHEAVEAMLIEAIAAGRLPHALILGGPRGIGKATLAFRLARHLLAEVGSAGEGGSLFADTAAPGAPRSLALAPEHPVFRRVAAGGHADLQTIERGYDRRGRQRGEIVVDEVRAVPGFLRLTPAEGGWRIVVIDCADDLNRNAANALLKIIEEPPRRSLLILVSHNPGRLLPTIRSRCRRITLCPLAANVMEALLRRYRPDLEAAEARMLQDLAEGSIGRALELADTGGLDLERTLRRLLERLPELDIATLHAFAERFIRPDSEAAWRIMQELLLQKLSRMIAAAARGEAPLPGHPRQAPLPNPPPRAGEGRVGAKEGEGRVEEAGEGRLETGRRSLDRWGEVWEKLTRLFAQADSLNLDRKQVVLDAFLALEAAAR